MTILTRAGECAFAFFAGPQFNSWRPPASRWPHSASTPPTAHSRFWSVWPLGASASTSGCEPSKNALHSSPRRPPRVLRNLIPDFEDKGWLVARQRNLPAECRGYVVIFPPSGELGFVIGLSGDWPDRGSLEDPQRVASELSAYGRPHVPVCLAAFVTGYSDDYPFGVLTATPTRLLDALVDTEQSFVDERAAALERIRIAHLPPEPLAGTVPMEETFAKPATDFTDYPTEQEVM